MVIFVLKIVNFRLIFTIIQEIKFGKLFFHSFQHIAHVFFLKVGSKLWGGVCMSLVGTEHIWNYFEQDPTSYCQDGSCQIKNCRTCATMSIINIRCLKLQRGWIQSPWLATVAYFVSQLNTKMLEAAAETCIRHQYLRATGIKELFWQPIFPMNIDRLWRP